MSLCLPLFLSFFNKVHTVFGSSSAFCLPPFSCPFTLFGLPGTWIGPGLLVLWQTPFGWVWLGAGLWWSVPLVFCPGRHRRELGRGADLPGCGGLRDPDGRPVQQAWKWARAGTSCRVRPDAPGHLTQHCPLWAHPTGTSDWEDDSASIERGFLCASRLTSAWTDCRIKSKCYHICFFQYEKSTWEKHSPIFRLCLHVDAVPVSCVTFFLGFIFLFYVAAQLSSNHTSSLLLQNCAHLHHQRLSVSHFKNQLLTVL